MGNYRLIGRLGEGGMGRVFLGLSPGGRQVAVKVIHPGHASGKQFRERFAREIEAARRVGGFHTASVVDADPAADPPWMVTAFIHGPSLQKAVAERGPFRFDEVGRLGAGLAEGLGAIHACGLVHRDLKPSNVILADDGPRIIDFGIARAAEASAMTTAGMVVGTYSYMSPEQLQGEVAGPASDVFALGCTLAFAATARVAFGDDSIVAVVYRIVTEPPDLTGVAEQRGLRQLLSECLAKNPAARPSLTTILERLAEVGSAEADTGEPFPADLLFGPTRTAGTGAGAPPGPDLSGRDQRPARETGPAADPAGPGRRGRRPGLRTVLIAAAAAVVAAGAVLGVLLSSGSPHASHPAAVQSSAGTTGHPSARPTADSGPAAPGQPEVSLHDPGGKNVFGDVFGSETVLATGDSSGSSYLWNVTDGKLITSLKDPGSNGVNGIAFNSATDTYAMADANGSIYLWNASADKLTATLSNGSRDDNRIAYSPDGSMVAVGSSGGSTYLWNVAAGKLSAKSATSLHDPGGKSVYGVAFSPDGGMLAAGDTDGSTYLWDVATGQLTATFKDPGSKGLYDIAFSPDGNLVAVSDVSSITGDGVVYLWDVATGKLAGTLESFYNSEFADVAFSPDGRFLAAGDTIGNVSFWNVATGKFVASLSDPVGKGVIGVAFSPRGDALTATDTAGDAYVWNTKWLGS